jgi:hypothetical protein
MCAFLEEECFVIPLCLQHPRESQVHQGVDTVSLTSVSVFAEFQEQQTNRRHTFITVHTFDKYAIIKAGQHFFKRGNVPGPLTNRLRKRYVIC